MSDVLVAENLSGVRHGFFTRAWGGCGLSDRFDIAEQLANRAKVAAHLQVSADNLLSCFQIHSPDAVSVTQIWHRQFRPHADAMVTNVPGIALGVLTADCGPVLFADTKNGIIGAAHAGWRGALTGVLENTVKAMRELGAETGSIRAAIGPCVGWNSYEVGPEFPAPFLAENPDHEKLFRPSVQPDHYLFNLPGYIEAKLHAVGVHDIEPSPADTYRDEGRFFSYRRDTHRKVSPTPSLISAIALAA